MPTPGVFPDRSPDSIGADMTDQKKTREEQSAEVASRDEDDPHLQKPDNTTHPLNPSPERNSQIIAERDERPGS